MNFLINSTHKFIPLSPAGTLSEILALLLLLVQAEIPLETPAVFHTKFLTGFSPDIPSFTTPVIYLAFFPKIAPNFFMDASTNLFKNI